jgi:hypothetical protein
VVGPYTGVGGRAPGLPWLRLLVRFFIVVVPAQLLGTAVGGGIVSASGVLADNPQLANLIALVAGTVAGTAVGLLVDPVLEYRRTYIVVNAVFAVSSWVLLLAIAQLRLPAGSQAGPWTGYVVGALLVGGVQTLLGWGLWVARHRL